MYRKELKKFAAFARSELKKQVAKCAAGYGLIYSGEKSEKLKNSEYADSLFYQYHKKGYTKLIEDTAYTWFNYMMIIRFMEVNGYLPHRIRILSSSLEYTGEPDVLFYHDKTDLPLDKKRIAELIDKGEKNAVFRELFLAQCFQLCEIIPYIKRPADYECLLLPENLLQKDSIIDKLVSSEELTVSFKEIEVIGWLYQYYNEEKKKELSGLKRLVIEKEELPIVTQLFTPMWIVKYMVQNSLGNICRGIDKAFKNHEHEDYFFEIESERMPSENSIEDIKFLDPACGSGHILVYAFDYLYDIYKIYGYKAEEIPYFILNNNLFGLDIDSRAVQMTCFALIMKARARDVDFFGKLKNPDFKLNVFEFIDSEKVSQDALNYFCNTEQEIMDIEKLLEIFSSGKQFGSLLCPPKIDVYKFLARYKELRGTHVFSKEKTNRIVEIKNKVLPVLHLAKCLSMKYHAVITNPPYHKMYNPVLKKFMHEKYRDYNSDLYSAFIYRCSEMTVENGLASLMTPFTWMFISSHQKLREYIIENKSISSLVQLEYSAFKEATVPICIFVIHNQNIDTIGNYISLTGFRGDEEQPSKVREAAANPSVSYYFRVDCRMFKDIPGRTFAYWASERIRYIFKQHKKLSEIAEPRVGLFTCNNDYFLRLWYEVRFDRIKFGLNSEEVDGSEKWIPYNKGGAYRKWYGNQKYIVDFSNKGQKISEYRKSKGQSKSLPGREYYFKEGISWSFVNSAKFGARYFPKGFVFDVSGSSIFGSGCWLNYMLAFLCSNVAFELLKYLNPTLNFQAGNIASLPVILDRINKPHIDELVRQNIKIAKEEWDYLETSWNFKKHPFLLYRENKKFSDIYGVWEDYAEQRFYRMKRNEEKLNEIFIDIYGLEEELSQEVADREITIKCADPERDAKSFLSYAVGCIMGRYSLDVEGIAYAGGKWDDLNYNSFIPDEKGIIPLSGGFENDILVQLYRFLETAFSPESAGENIYWLADKLGMKKEETPEARLKRYFLNEFYKDHNAFYKKRPIYWMVNSGRNRSFCALIYQHRFNIEKLNVLRYEYLMILKNTYAAEIENIEEKMKAGILNSWELKEKLDNLKVELNEILDLEAVSADLYDKNIGLDLDAGVVKNYKKLQPILI